MKRKPLEPNQTSLFGAPVPLDMFAEHLLRAAVPDPVAEYKKQLAAKPLPGQIPMEEA